MNHPASFPETKNRGANLRADLEAQLCKHHVEAVQEHIKAKTFENFVEEILKQI